MSKAASDGCFAFYAKSEFFYKISLVIDVHTHPGHIEYTITPELFYLYPSLFLTN
jgi:hypothetical protein